MTVFEFLDLTAFYFSSFLVLTSILTFTILQKHTDRPQNKTYISIVLGLILTAICEILTKAATPVAMDSMVARAVLETSAFLYFVFHMAMPVQLHLYAMQATRMSRRFSLAQHFIGTAPAIVGEGLIFLNPLTHWVFWFDENAVFHRGWAENLLYVISIVYFLTAMGIFFFRWHAVTPRRKRILVYSLFVTVIGVVIQFLFVDVTVELFAESISLLGIMLSVEYDEDQQDAVTGVYNRAAMLTDFRSFFELGLPFYVIAVQFRNLELIKRLSSYSNQELLEKVGENLRAIHPRYMIYRATPSSFLLVSLSNDRKKASDLADTLLAQINREWKPEERDIPLKTAVLYAAVPEELKSMDDVLLMCESALPEDSYSAPLAGEDLQFLFDQAALSEAIHRGMSEHNFEIVYQLVYSAKRQRPEAAESLMRLHDKHLGDIPPSAFIAVAERNGMIRELGEYALRMVCEFLQTDIPEKLGIRFVEINLSILQCTNPDFVPRVSAIVEEYGVSPKMICFEISETAAEVDLSLLSATIDNLKARGFLFSMDRYGAGSANMYSIFAMDFDIIKLDKSLLDLAMESENGKIILESSIRMVHEMNRSVALVGVENAAQLAIFKNLPINYLQGKYFADATSLEELQELSENGALARKGSNRYNM